MKNEPRWVPRIVIDAAHLEQLREHGGLAGVRDENALEGALARAQQKWHYDGARELAVLAAAYGHGIARNHPFRDGNKRAAFLAMAIFLGLNGHEIDATEEDVVLTMLMLAAGDLAEDALATWLRKHIVAEALP